MSTKELVLPSPSHSRPETPRVAELQPIHIGSSPSSELPSLSRLLDVRAKAFRTGSKAARIPNDAPTQFKSAASLFKDMQSSDAVCARPDNVLQSIKASQIQGPRVSRREKSPTEAGGRTKELETMGKNVKRTPEKSRVFKSKVRFEPDVEDPGAKNIVYEIPESPIAAQAARSLPTPPPVPAPAAHRKRSPENRAEQQTKITKGRVTKPKDSGKGTKPARGVGAQRARSRSTAVVSEHFKQRDGQVSAEMLRNPGKETDNDVSVMKRVDTSEPLLLERAPARRTDWTPPKAFHGIQAEPEIISPVTDHIKDTRREALAKQPFPELLDTFAYATKRTDSMSASPEKSPRAVSGEPFAKKRRIEVSQALSYILHFTNNTS